MKSNIQVKIPLLITVFIFTCLHSSGQAILPFSYDGGKPVSSFTGLTQSGLGTDYTTSPKMKFDTTGDNLILNFIGAPGILSFKIKWNLGFAATRFPGDFFLQESSDGIVYTTVQLYNSANGTPLTNTSFVNEQISNLLPTSRFLKWMYLSKTNGNIGIGAINLTAGIHPVLFVSTNSLKGFTYITDTGSSPEQSFTINGNILNKDIIITPPADFEISKGTGALFIPANPVTLTQTNGVVPSTILYTRLKSGLSVGNYNEDITVTSFEANSVSITCSGTVTAKPTITLLDVTNPIFSTVQGSPVSQSINISGVNLSSDLGISISGTDAGLFTFSQNKVAQTNGKVPNTILTITYNPVSTGTNSATLMMSSTGAMPVTRTLNGLSSILANTTISKTTYVVSVDKGNIQFTANAGETVEIYTVTGQKLFQKMALEGMNIIHIAVKGVLFLKVGIRVEKVIL